MQKLLILILFFISLSVFSLKNSTPKSKRLEHQERELVNSKDFITKTKPQIIMEPGESKTIPISYNDKIWMSQAGIISLHDTDTALHIRARKKGNITLSAGSNIYKIQVLDPTIKTKLSHLNQLLSQKFNLKALVVKDQIQIHGTLYRLKDFIDISKLAQKYQINFLFWTEVNPKAKLKNYIQKKMSHNKELANSMKIIWKKPITLLFPQDLASDASLNQIRTLGLAMEKSPFLIPPLPLIETKVIIIATSNNQSFQMHFDWGKNILNRILDGHIFKQIVSELKTIEAEGKAHTIAETLLLSENGKEVSFQSGGEIAIPHFNPETGSQGFKWKPYGINLNLTAKTDSNNRMHITTKINVSSANTSAGISKALSFKRSQIHSSVNMLEGQGLILTKLIQRQNGKHRSAPLEIFNLPIAGPLLSFKGKAKDHTRINIFLRSRKVKALHPKR